MLSEGDGSVVSRITNFIIWALVVSIKPLHSVAVALGSKLIGIVYCLSLWIYAYPILCVRIPNLFVASNVTVPCKDEFLMMLLSGILYSFSLSLCLWANSLASGIFVKVQPLRWNLLLTSFPLPGWEVLISPSDWVGQSIFIWKTPGVQCG